MQAKLLEQQLSKMLIITIEKPKLVSNPCSNYFSIVFIRHEMLYISMKLYKDL
jgi:hypothetical protein